MSEAATPFAASRARIASWYRQELPNLPVEPIPAGIDWNRWLFAAQTRDAAGKAALLRALAKAGCQARPLWAPIPRQKPYRTRKDPRLRQYKNPNFGLQRLDIGGV